MLRSCPAAAECTESFDSVQAETLGVAAGRGRESGALKKK